MAVTMHQLLKTLVDQNGTDLHITTNSPPQIRIDGKMVPLQVPPMNTGETKNLIYSVLTDAQKHRFEESLELDLSFGVKGLARFRANVFYQRGAVAGAFRTIPWEIRSLESLGLPDVVQSLCERPRLGRISRCAMPGSRAFSAWKKPGDTASSVSWSSALWAR